MDAFRADSAARGVVVLVALGLATTTLAAAVTPGAVEQTLREPPQFPLQEAPEDAVQTPSQPIRQVPSGGRPVNVIRFEFSGNEAIGTETLRRQVAQYEGTAMTLEGIFFVADELSTYYHRMGYGLTTVTVPAQRVEDGIIELEVIEGRVEDVTFRGNTRYSSEFLAGQVGDLAGGSVFRSDTMERRALLLNDLPGLEARAVISPGSEYGTSDIVFNVTEDPSTYRFTVDNYGRESIGEWRMVADATFNGLGGRADRLNVGGVVSESGLLKYVKGAYGWAVDDQGSRFRINANHSEYDVSGDPALAPLFIDGLSTNLRLEYTRPLTRTRTGSSILGVTLMHTVASSERGLPPNETQTSDTDITLLEISWAKQTVYNNGAVSSLAFLYSGNFSEVRYADVTQGIVDGSQQRGRFELISSVSMPIADRWAFLGRSRIQASIDPLVDTQSFFLGGPNSVRAYGPSEVRGDQGVFVSGELYRYFRMGSLPSSASFFIDAGRVWRKDIPGCTAFACQDSTDGLVGWGLALSINPGGRFSTRLEYAHVGGGHRTPVAPGEEPDTSQFWANFVAEF